MPLFSMVPAVWFHLMHSSFGCPLSVQLCFGSIVSLSFEGTGFHSSLASFLVSSTPALKTNRNIDVDSRFQYRDFISWDRLFWELFRRKTNNFVRLVSKKVSQIQLALIWYVDTRRVCMIACIALSWKNEKLSEQLQNLLVKPCHEAQKAIQPWCSQIMSKKRIQGLREKSNSEEKVHAPSEKLQLQNTRRSVLSASPPPHLPFRSTCFFFAFFCFNCVFLKSAEYTVTPFPPLIVQNVSNATTTSTTKYH